MKTTRHLLPLCVGASLAAHAAALWFWPAGAPLPPAPRSGDAGLQLTLARAIVSAPAPAAVAQPVAAAAAMLPARHNSPPAQAAPPAPPAQANTRADLATTPATVPGETGTTDASAGPGAAGSPLLTQLRDALLPHFHYPLLARRQGWEGTVQVGMRITAGGQIIQLRIVESSRHAVLDQAAIACLGKIRQLPGAIAWLHGSDQDIVIPVEYRLTDS